MTSGCSALSVVRSSTPVSRDSLAENTGNKQRVVISIINLSVFSDAVNKDN
jgi:hypothetical protein